MPKDHDFKRLVRARMDRTGERYTQARAALVAERAAPAAPDAQQDPPVSDRTRSVLGQLADLGLAKASRRYLDLLPEPQRRAAAIEGLRHQDWRVRRASAQLLDKVDLTAESVAALTRALYDEHPQVRRNAVHSLSCEHCKPNGCVVDVRPLFERVIRDRSILVRSMVVHVCTLHFPDHQWSVDLMARVAAADPSPNQRAWADGWLRSTRERWESNDRRRELPRDLVRKTERHAGLWVAIRDGRIAAVANSQHRVFGRAMKAGAARYWVAPAGVRRPEIP